MRPKRAVRHRPTPRQHSRRQRKMKVKKSEIQLLIAVIGVLIAVCTYFLVYSSFNEKSDALEAQNVTLSSQVATLEILDQRKADYIEATGKMQSYITNFENRFPADILPEDSIIHGVERNVVNYYIPFQVERLDSLLRARLSQYDFQIAFLPEGDTLSRFNSWKILPEHLFPPCLGVKYRYAPLERKGVMIEVGFPINPLLKRMVGQLILSLFLILLLLSCLGLQINTILKQYKLGEMRESFVHTMIHELRRPVQTLKMCVSFLNDKEMRTDEAACDGIVQDALFELDNLSAYLEKLKNMVSADGSATLLHPILFNLQELVEKVIRLVHIPSGKQVAFSTAFPPDLPLVTADPVHIANILSNLIENAIKYSGSGVNIRVVVIRNDKLIELTVTDDGVGISADEQTKVFEKFYRSVHLPDKQIPGLGLGLSYVRQIAEAHHGQVSLRSEVGKGTEVTVGLPI